MDPRDNLSMQKSKHENMNDKQISQQHNSLLHYALYRDDISWKGELLVIIEKNTVQRVMSI